MVDFCQHGNESCGSTKRWEILEQLLVSPGLGSMHLVKLGLKLKTKLGGLSQRQRTKITTHLQMPRLRMLSQASLHFHQ
jgi:hypothetical protein